MEHYSKENISNAILVITSIIARCEKAQMKFKEGTSQFSLLRNRIKALKISNCLLENSKEKDIYSIADIENALPPIISIIHKTETARNKYEKESSQYRRLTPTITAMYISKDFLEKALTERQQE